MAWFKGESEPEPPLHLMGKSVVSCQTFPLNQSNEVCSILFCIPKKPVGHLGRLGGPAAAEQRLGRSDLAVGGQEQGRWSPGSSAMGIYGGFLRQVNPTKKTMDHHHFNIF